HIPASGRGERFAALEPARLQDVLAARRRHPGPKPVDTAPVSLFGLERSLHGEGPPGRTLYSLPTARSAGSGLIQSADGTISGVWADTVCRRHDKRVWASSDPICPGSPSWIRAQHRQTGPPSRLSLA